MKVLAIVFLCALMLVIGGTSGAVTRHVPGQYSTIETAINASYWGDTVLVQPVNGALVRLEWNPVPAVTSYRIYRSESPDMSGAFLLEETSETLFEDLHELGTAKTYFYRVQGVNACGQE